MKFELFDRAEEIFEKLPKDYANIILNSVIAQSVSNGILLKEASYFMKSKDLEDLQEQLEIKKKKITKEDIEKVKITKTKTKDVSTFDGFD